MCMKNREQRPTVKTHPVSIPITQATKSDLARNGEPLPEETRGGAGKRSCGSATRRPDVSRNELPMTQEWQGPGQISGGSTQRAGVGSGLVFGRDCTGVWSPRTFVGGRTWWFQRRSVNACGHTPHPMGAIRRVYTTPHTLTEDATRNHGRVRYNTRSTKIHQTLK